MAKQSGKPNGSESGIGAWIGQLKNNPLAIIVALTVVVVVGAVVVARDKTAGSYEKQVDMKYFTNFRDRMNDVTAVRMVTRGSEFNVKLVNGQWVIPDRYSYPVGIEKVRNIVLNASELEVLEVKTNDPTRLTELGLDDPEKKDSESVRITLYDQANQVMADFIAGKRRKSGGRTFYTRNVDNPQAYLVKGEGWLQLDLSPGYWLSSEIFRLAEDKIERASYTFPASAPSKNYTIARSQPAARQFRIDELPAGRQIKSDNDVTDAAFALSHMQLVGVSPITAMSFPDKDSMINTYHSFDGMDVIVTSVEDKDKDRWITIQAKADGPGVKQEVRDEADRINAAVKDWAYIAAEDSAKLLTKKLDELTEEANAANTKPAVSAPPVIPGASVVPAAASKPETSAPDEAEKTGKVELPSKLPEVSDAAAKEKPATKKK